MEKFTFNKKLTQEAFKYEAIQKKRHINYTSNSLIQAFIKGGKWGRNTNLEMIDTLIEVKKELECLIENTQIEGVHVTEDVLTRVNETLTKAGCNDEM